jgi:hypothetical protein
VVEENHGLASTTQADEPLLHVVPTLRVVFAPAIDEGRPVIEEENLCIANPILNKSLVRP